MISDAVQWALPYLREQAVSLMTDRWVIHAIGKDADPLTGQGVKTLVYDGPGKLQSYEGHEQPREASGRVTVIQRMTLHLPIGPYRPQVNHVAKCVESQDPNLVGTEYRITQDAPFKSHATAYRAFVDFAAT